MLKLFTQSKVVRYLLSAGVATLVDISVYFIAFNFIYHKQDITLFNSFVVTAPTAALLLSYTAGLITNFLITKFLVFHESDLETHKQLFRYILVALVVLSLNYVLMRFLIRNLEWYPTIARAFSAVSIGMISFIIHKTFSFRVSKEKRMA